MTTKGDRVLVWLTMFTLVFGGLGATVSVFFSDVVMARRHPPPQAEPVKPSGTTSSTLEGTGIVVAVEAEKSRLVVDQQEIGGSWDLWSWGTPSLLAACSTASDRESG